MKGHCLKPGLRHDPRGRSSRRGLRAGRGTRSWWPQPTEPQLRDQYPLRIPQRGQSDQRRSAGSNGTAEHDVSFRERVRNGSWLL